MGFVALASVYCQATHCDSRQGVLVLCVSMAGLFIAWRLNVGILVGLYCIETWFVLLGLVVSDIFRAACQRRVRPKDAEEEKKATGLEMKWEGGVGSPV